MDLVFKINLKKKKRCFGKSRNIENNSKQSCKKLHRTKSVSLLTFHTNFPGAANVSPYAAIFVGVTEHNTSAHKSTCKQMEKT